VHLQNFPPDRTAKLLDCQRPGIEIPAPLNAGREPRLGEFSSAPSSATQGTTMQHYFWNDWYLGWGWFLWFGIIFLLFSSMGNWRYTYAAHRKYGLGAPVHKEAFDILNERYAGGEITREQFIQMKSDISKAV
jgi:putative membrane protein